MIIMLSQRLCRETQTLNKWIYCRTGSFSIQFSLFSLAPNYKFASEGFTVCTHWHPCPRGHQQGHGGRRPAHRAGGSGKEAGPMRSGLWARRPREGGRAIGKEAGSRSEDAGSGGKGPGPFLPVLNNNVCCSQLLENSTPAWHIVKHILKVKKNIYCVKTWRFLPCFPPRWNVQSPAPSLSLSHL